MGDHRTLKLLKGRVCGDAVEASEGVAASGVFSQNEGRLVCGQFSCVDRFSATPPCEDSLSRYPQIAHPIHYSIRGAYIALPVPLHNREHDSTRLPAFAPTHREQVHGVAPKENVRSYELNARAHQGQGQHISQTRIKRNLRFFCHGFLPFSQLLLGSLNGSCSRNFSMLGCTENVATAITLREYWSLASCEAFSSEERPFRHDHHMWSYTERGLSCLICDSFPVTSC